MSLPHSHNCHITSAGLIRAAFSPWLAYHTGSDDVVFGVTLSGQTAPMPGIEDLEGPTIAVIPIRIYYHRDETIGDYLKQLQQQAARMLQFKQLGLKSIRRISGDAQIACDFRTLLVVEKRSEDGSSANMTSLEDEPNCTLLPGGTQNAVFHTLPLILGCSLSSRGEVQLELLYDSRAVASTDAALMLHQFQLIVRQLAAAPSDLALSELDIVSPEGRNDSRVERTIPVGSISLCLHMPS
jgi:non-ribosomal peptide synthetase component F